MIIKTFDQGFDRQYPLKQYEQDLVTGLTRHFVESDQRVVLINSVWYTNDMNQQVVSWLRTNHWDQIILIAMLDAAIPGPDQYAEFSQPVTGIGYYPGMGQVDFWALFVDHFFQPIEIDTLINTSVIDTAYMCLNRKPHWHRLQLYRQLQELDLVSKGIVSMGGNGQAITSLTQDQEHDTFGPNATRAHYGIPNDIASLGHKSNWHRHFINVVTETFYDINNTGFVSEKIYKPIVGCRPFLVYDTDGGTRWLQQRGFKPYTKDFQDISDLDLSQPHNIPKFLSVLCAQSPDYWQQKFVGLQEKILYNKKHFVDYADKQRSIVKKGIPCYTNYNTGNDQTKPI